MKYFNMYLRISSIIKKSVIQNELRIDKCHLLQLFNVGQPEIGIPSDQAFIPDPAHKQVSYLKSSGFFFDYHEDAICNAGYFMQYVYRYFKRREFVQFFPASFHFKNDCTL